MGRSRTKSVTRVFILLAVIIFILAVRFYEEIGQEQRPEDRFYVVKVIDGDTFELRGGDKVRLLSIDTPEHGEPYFDDARQLLEKLVLYHNVTLEYQQNRRDKYGRLLGYVYVDSQFVNKIILEQGLGYLYLFKNNEINLPETKELLAAQRTSLAKKQGIWTVKYTSEPYYIVKSGSFRFHRPGCNSVRELTEGRYRRIKNREDALVEGLSPCRNCKP